MSAKYVKCSEAVICVHPKEPKISHAAADRYMIMSVTLGSEWRYCNENVDGLPEMLNDEKRPKSDPEEVREES